MFHLSLRRFASSKLDLISTRYDSSCRAGGYYCMLSVRLKRFASGGPPERVFALPARVSPGAPPASRYGGSSARSGVDTRLFVRQYGVVVRKSYSWCFSRMSSPLTTVS